MHVKNSKTMTVRLFYKTPGRYRYLKSVTTTMFKRVSFKFLAERIKREVDNDVLNILSILQEAIDKAHAGSNKPKLARFAVTGKRQISLSDEYPPIGLLFS